MSTKTVIATSCSRSSQQLLQQLFTRTNYSAFEPVVGEDRTGSGQRRHSLLVCRRETQSLDASMRRPCLWRLILAGYVVLLSLLLFHHYLLLDLSDAIVAQLANRTSAQLNGDRFFAAGWPAASSFQRQTFGEESRFLLTPTMGRANCSRLGIVYVLKSRPAEFFQRVAIRDTWGKTLQRRLVTFFN